MYYLMETNYFFNPTAYRTSSLVSEFKFKPSRWITGHLMGEPKEPLTVEFWQNGGDGQAELLLDSIPVFSKSLIKSLENSGVDNLQTFPINIIERDEGTINEQYLAVNILGCIKCADMELSEYTDITGEGLFAVNFRKLVIDEEKARGQYIFRLAESVSSIIIHESVKKQLENEGYKYILFRPLANDG